MDEAETENEILTFDEWTEPGDKFALRVVGDSMIGDQIRDGDYVIIRKANTAIDGEIVAFRDVDGGMLLRRYRRMGTSVRLVASDPRVPTIRNDDVKILGVLVGVVRKY